MAKDAKETRDELAKQVYVKWLDTLLFEKKALEKEEVKRLARQSLIAAEYWLAARYDQDKDPQNADLG